LLVSSQNSWARQLGDGRVLYKGIFNMDVGDVAVGKPVNYQLPKEKKVLSGKAVCTVNNDVRFEINIPEQKPQGGLIIIGDLSEAFSNFEQ